MNDQQIDELIRRVLKDRVGFWNVWKNGDKLHEMIMLADTDSSYVVIRMTGNFTMDDLQELAGQSENDNKK